jgi:hypothetical protein
MTSHITDHSWLTGQEMKKFTLNLAGWNEGLDDLFVS